MSDYELTEATDEQVLLESARRTRLSRLFDVDPDLQAFSLPSPDPRPRPRSPARGLSFPNVNPLLPTDAQALEALGKPRRLNPGASTHAAAQPPLQLPSPEQLHAQYGGGQRHNSAKGVGGTPQGGQSGDFAAEPRGEVDRLPARQRRITLYSLWRRLQEDDDAKSYLGLFVIGVLSHYLAGDNAAMKSALLLGSLCLPILLGVFKPHKREMSMSVMFFCGVLLSALLIR